MSMIEYVDSYRYNNIIVIIIKVRKLCKQIRHQTP